MKYIGNYDIYTTKSQSEAILFSDIVTDTNMEQVVMKNAVTGEYKILIKTPLNNLQPNEFIKLVALINKLDKSESD